MYASYKRSSMVGLYNSVCIEDPVPIFYKHHKFRLLFKLRCHPTPIVHVFLSLKGILSTLEVAPYARIMSGGCQNSAGVLTELSHLLFTV